MLLIQLIPNLPHWYRKIIKHYALTVSVIDNGEDDFYATASGFSRKPYLAKPIYSTSNSDELKLIKTISSGNNQTVTISISCGITHLQLGQLDATINSSQRFAYINTLASMRGILVNLRLKGQMGIALGSLLITSLSLLLERFNLQGCKINLSSLRKAAPFYEHLGMIRNADDDFEYIGAFPFPNQAYYKNILSELDQVNEFHMPALTIQRHWRTHRILAICQSTELLLNELENYRETLDSNSPEHKELSQFINYFYRDSRIKPLSRKIATDIQTKFIGEKYKNNPLVNEIINQALTPPLPPSQTKPYQQAEASSRCIIS